MGANSLGLFIASPTAALKIMNIDNTEYIQTMTLKSNKGTPPPITYTHPSLYHPLTFQHEMASCDTKHIVFYII